MPPSEPPATAASRVMPSSSSSARSTRTMSATVITGKSEPYGRPVAGLVDDGPVVPRQPPSRFELTTKKRSVSKALPGPIMPSHQPRPRPLPASRSSARKPSRVLAAAGARAVAGGVRVAAQRVADEDHVVARRRQRAVGLVGDRGPGAARARSRARSGSRQVEELRLDRADRARRRASTLAWSSRRSYRDAVGAACMTSSLARPLRIDPGLRDAVRDVGSDRERRRTVSREREAHDGSIDRSTTASTSTRCSPRARR